MLKFYGSYLYTVDSKGRVNIPAPFRSQFPKTSKGAAFYITVGPNATGPNKCLSLFPKKVFENITSEIKKECGSFLKPNSTRVDFLKMMDRTRLCRWDKQGRIIVPKELLKEAEINGEVKIVGAVDIIELWNPEHFKRYIGEGNSSEQSG